MSKIKLEILEYNYWEHFKAAKDISLILPLEHPKRKRYEVEMNRLLKQKQNKKMLYYLLFPIWRLLAGTMVGQFLSVCICLFTPAILITCFVPLPDDKEAVQGMAFGLAVISLGLSVFVAYIMIRIDDYMQDIYDYK